MPLVETLATMGRGPEMRPKKLSGGPSKGTPSLGTCKVTLSS